MSQNIEQIYIANPTTSMVSTDLLYLGRSPYNTSDDFAITFANFVLSIGTATKTASTISRWDANVNMSANNFIDAFATTATAGATTTLLVGSPYFQYFTGATTQTVVMPVTSTLAQGQSWMIVNNSSGAVTINSSGGNAIQVLASNTSAIVTCQLTSGTSAASWNATYISDAGGSVSVGTINQVAFYAAAGDVVSGVGPGSAGQLFQSNGAGSPPAYTTATYPTTAGTAGTVIRSDGTNLVNSTAVFADTYAVSTLLYASSSNTVSGLATANSGVLITSAGGVPSISSTLPSGIAATNMNLTTPTLGVASATSISFGGTALANYVQDTWTPVYAGSGGGSATYTLQQASYTRIGNRVLFDLSIIISASTLVGNITITGLPIAPGPYYAACSIYASSLGATATPTLMANIVSSSIISLYTFAAGTATALDTTALGSSAVIVITGSYYTSA
jgi:hypothetical protein